jgi:hypothetical protein
MSATKIQIRRDTASNWYNVNPQLSSGEIGFETDTGKFKIGNGTNIWRTLDYASVLPSGISSVAVTSFNSRQGEVTLTDTDVNTALGYTAADAADLSGFQSSTNTDISNAITTAEGYTDTSIENLNIGTNGAGNVVSTNGTQTLTNKTLGSSTSLSENLDANSKKILNLSDPDIDTDATNKGYVDKVIENVYHSIFVNFATTEPIDAINNDGDSGEYGAGIGGTLTGSSNGSLTVDGVEVDLSDRILIKDQADAKQNGIYYITTAGDLNNPWVATRTSDYNNSFQGQLIGGRTIYVGEGNTFSRTTWFMDSLGSSEFPPYAIVIGTDNINFQQSAGSGTYIAGNGLNLSGSSFSINTDVVQTRVTNVSNTEIGYLDGVTSSIQTQINSKAPIASPTFTGTPAAPTASSVTNSTQVATTEFVHTAVDNLINGAGPAYDTLKELADLIISDESTASALATTVGNKAPIDSPTFTGTVTLPLTTAGYVTTSNTGIISSVATIPNAGLTNSAITINGTSVSLGGSRTLGTDDVSEGTTNKYFTDERAQDAVGQILGTGLTYNDASNTITVDTTNIQLRVSGVSDTEIGYLDGVTSAIQTQIDAKAPTSNPTFTGTVAGITKSMVGLGSVDNTTDAEKPISTATQTALDLKLASATAATTYETITNVALKAPLYSPTFTGTVTLPTGTVTSAMILDGTIVDADINASAAIAQSKISGLSTSLGLKADLASPTFTGTITLPLTTAGYVTTTSGGVISSVATIPNSGLTNSSVTVGTTAIALGASSTTLAGLTSVTSTAFVGGLTGNVSGNASTVTNGVYTTDSGTVTNAMLAGSIANSKLSNSTISGVSLGSNLSALTIGTGLSGTSYNGSGAVTIAIDSTVATLTGSQTLTNKTLSSAVATGGITHNGATSGTIVVKASDVAGSNTLTFPAATDTLVGKATTDTLTNKTLDTAGTGNVLKINGTGISAVTGTGAVALAGSPTFTGTIGAAAVTTTGDVTVGGNLTVNGTTTTLNTTTLVVADANIEIAKVATPTDVTANGAGITIKGATDKTLNWYSSTSALTSSENVDLASGKTYKINSTDVLTATKVLGKGFSTTAGDIALIDGTQTLTNKTISGASNTLTVRLASDVTGILPILNGGTGATTASTAAAALLPSQTSNSGKYLTTDGSGTLSWGTVSGYSAPTIGSTSIGSGATVTNLAGVTINSTTIPTSATLLTSGGALGTPSSATLTNATSLPISGLTSSTTTALGLGSIELGHASDTTISRVSAGVAAIEGVNIVTTSSTDTLTNKTLTSPTISSITNTGTITIPTTTGTLALLSQVVNNTLLTTTGDIVYASSANTPARLAAGTSGYILTAQGAGVAPVWAAAPSSAPSAGSVTFAMLANETKIMHIMQAY